MNCMDNHGRGSAMAILHDRPTIENEWHPLGSQTNFGDQRPPRYFELAPTFFNLNRRCSEFVGMSLY